MVPVEVPPGLIVWFVVVSFFLLGLAFVFSICLFVCAYRFVSVVFGGMIWFLFRASDPIVVCCFRIFLLVRREAVGKEGEVGIERSSLEDSDVSPSSLSFSADVWFINLSVREGEFGRGRSLSLRNFGCFVAFG